MKLTKKAITFALSLAMLLSLAACGASQSAAPASEKTAPAEEAAGFEIPKQIEFVCCYGAGGGHDTMLRNMEKAIRSNNLVSADTAITYNYQNGGAQAVGMTYTMSQAGNEALLMSTTAGLVKTPLTMDLGFGWRDMSPLVIWGETSQFLVVRADNPANTVEELFASGKSLTFTNVGAGGSEEYVALRLKQLNPDVDLVSVTYDGDAAQLTEILGGHVDAAFLSIGVFQDYLAENGGTGELKALACTSKQRSQYLPDVPTLIEQGYDVYTIQLRGMCTAPEISPEAFSAYEDLMVKLYDTPEFKEYCEIEGVERNLLKGQEMIDFLEDFEDIQIEAYKLADVELLEEFR